MSISKKIRIIDRNIISDSRGYFVKLLTGKEDDLPTYTGEIYLTSAKPNEIKGGHYHPQAKEWFILLQGQCRLDLVDISTQEKMSIDILAQVPQTVYVPNGIAHQFVNTSSQLDFMLLAYTDKHYDPTDTIMYINF
jgi:dTDP-4-dehydrorhamnose 3,5-epimerase-like enzyme